jgi:hypothetical protein
VIARDRKVKTYHGDTEARRKSRGFNRKGRKGREGREKPLKHRGTGKRDRKNYRGLARMNAHYLDVGAQSASAALIVGLGILFQASGEDRDGGASRVFGSI